MNEISKLFSSVAMLAAGFLGASFFGPPDLADRLVERFAPPASDAAPWLEPAPSNTAAGKAAPPAATAHSSADPWSLGSGGPEPAAPTDAASPGATTRRTPRAPSGHTSWAPATGSIASRAGANDWFTSAATPTEASAAAERYPDWSEAASAWPTEGPHAPASGVRLSPPIGRPTTVAETAWREPAGPLLASPADGAPALAGAWPTRPTQPKAEVFRRPQEEASFGGPTYVGAPPTNEASPPNTSLDGRLPNHAAAAAGPRDEPLGTHVVTDGDTLPKLAQRYLGAAERAAELYELNRDRLDHPDLLPIGVVLRTPTNPLRGPAAERAPWASPADAAPPAGAASDVRPVGFVSGSASGDASRLVPVGDPVETPQPWEPRPLGVGAESQEPPRFRDWSW